MDHKIVKKNVRRALEEDRVRNDLSIKALKSFTEKLITAKLTVKESAILCGTAWFEESFNQVDPKIKIQWKFKEGDKLIKNSLVAIVKGPSNKVLSAERTALNFLQLMSGISTKTSNIIKLIKNKNIKLLDTRKTIPGIRYEQKYSTKIGGATNHRFDLSDGLMIKDNHIAAVGGLDKFSFKKNLKKGKFLEIEVKKISQLKAALKLNPDIIMLDNFSASSLQKAIKIINKQCLVEISGIRDTKQFIEFSKFDVNFISLGDLTKNIQSIDFSLNLES